MPASEQNWLWPESLEAMVAAPDHHAILFENEELRVIRTRVLPGHLVPWRTHRWPCVLFILGWSHLLRRNPLGGVTLDTRHEIEVPKLHIPIWQEPCRLTRLKTWAVPRSIPSRWKSKPPAKDCAFFCFA
jgi:hypothetical protein